jgi:plastocyanin
VKTSSKLLVLPLAIGALFFAGCGGSDDSSDNGSSADTSTTQSQPADNSGSNGSDTAGGAQTLALAADPSGALAYDTTELTAKPGKVTVDFTNDAPIPHDVKFEDSNGKEIGGTDIITGESATAEINVKPGTYTFFCSVPGHEAAGMKGTLTVK